jgi:hypothetical protein
MYLYTSYLIYNQIWLNLPTTTHGHHFFYIFRMDGHHFGYQQIQTIITPKN